MPNKRTIDLLTDSFKEEMSNRRKYEFKNSKDAEKAMNSKKLENLIKKFDQKWENKVHRTRELTEFVQII